MTIPHGVCVVLPSSNCSLILPSVLLPRWVALVVDVPVVLAVVVVVAVASQAVAAASQVEAVASQVVASPVEVSNQINSL